MLKANDIHKSYGNLKVLKGVTLEVQQGEIISIVGASGAGKSTLLHILGTLDNPDQGFLEINNVRIESRSIADLVPVSWWKRFFTQVIDLAVISGIAFLAGYLMYDQYTIEDGTLPGFEPTALLGDPVYWAFLPGVAFIYYTIMEGTTGRTLGKLVMQTKVIVKEEGTFPGFFRSVLRSLCRLVPFEFLSFIRRRPVGFHDTAANTMVVSAREPYRKEVKKSLSDKELSLFRNKNIGFVFQFHNLLPEFTALENVCMPAFIGSREEDEEIRGRAMELLQLLGIDHRANHKPSELSGGEQQRVAIARALINKPALVFADEPSGNLDSHNAEELHRLFFKLRDTLHQTFIIVTHNEKLANMADRKLEIVDGRMNS